MFNSSQPSQAFAAAAAGMAPADSGWVSEPDDVAFGCECADPSLQIASWGQEAGDVPAAAAGS